MTVTFIATRGVRASILLPTLLLALTGAAPMIASAQTPEEADTPVGAVDPGEEAREEAAESQAGPASFPRFTYGVGAELENDYTFEADDPAVELNDLFPTIEGAFALEFQEGAGLFSTVVIEPVLDPTGDREFEDVGLYAEELFAAATLGRLQIKGGKFNPAFGQTFDTAPGIFGAVFAEDYELTERVGGGVGFTTKALGGEHTISAALYRADRSVFSDSLLQSRGELDIFDGGASNTDGLESFSVAVDGGVDALSYNLGFRYQNAGRGSNDDEKGVVAGLAYNDIAMGAGAVSLLAEGAYLDNAGGGAANVFIGTVGAAYAIDAYTVSAAYALRDTSGPGGSTDHLLTSTVEYAIAEGLSGGVGYAYTREADQDAHTVGLLLSYEFGGGVSF